MAEKTNGIDEPLMMHFIREQNSLEAQIAALQDKRKNFRSRIKSFGVKLKNFDAVRRQFNAQDDGAEHVEDLREQRSMARLVGLASGFQYTFFDEQGNVIAKQAESTKGGAYEQGRAAYLALAKESENPFSPNLSQGQDWLKGYRDAETACKTGKERAAVGPQADEKPEAAKGTIAMNPKPRRGKAAAANDDSDDDDAPAPKPSAKKKPAAKKKAAK